MDTSKSAKIELRSLTPGDNLELDITGREGYALLKLYYNQILEFEDRGSGESTCRSAWVKNGSGRVRVTVLQGLSETVIRWMALKLPNALQTVSLLPERSKNLRPTGEPDSFWYEPAFYEGGERFLPIP